MFIACKQKDHPFTLSPPEIPGPACDEFPRVCMATTVVGIPVENEARVPFASPVSVTPDFPPKPSAAVSKLGELEFPRGLASQLVQDASNVFPIRFWVVDNSGSMQTGDGSQLMKNRGLWKSVKYAQAVPAHQAEQPALPAGDPGGVHARELHGHLQRRRAHGGHRGGGDALCRLGERGSGLRYLSSFTTPNRKP